MASIGERIKEFRKDKHLTQSELGKLVGASAQVISNYERRYSTPSAQDISDIAAALNVQVSSIYASTNSQLHSGSNAPDWATEADRIDLDKLLQSNTPMGYGGMSMAPEDKEKVRNVIEGIYWDRLKKLREEGKK